MNSNKVRPSDVNEVIGNKDVISAINHFEKTQTFPHFIILHGSSGTGKTTFAKIIANKIDPKSILQEVNASNNNGIDFFRQIIEDCKYSPISSKTKIYIFDEAHQITTQSQNCLLNFMETPPPYVYVIFCTTDLHKIIKPLEGRATILQTKPLKKEQVMEYINVLKNKLSVNINTDAVYRECMEHDVTAPRFILQYVERAITGSLYKEDTSDETDVFKFAKSVLKKDIDAGQLMRLYDKDNFMAYKKVTVSYLYTILQKETSAVQIVQVAGILNKINKSEDPYDFITVIIIARSKIV